MKFSRIHGRSAKVVWKLYELPLNPDTGIGVLGLKYKPNDGSDWSLGMTSKMGQLPHDGGMGLDGSLYYTVNNPNKYVTIGKVDTRAGEVKSTARPIR